MVMVGGVEIDVNLNYEGVHKTLKDLERKVGSTRLTPSIGIDPSVYRSLERDINTMARRVVVKKICVPIDICEDGINKVEKKFYTLKRKLEKESINIKVVSSQSGGFSGGRSAGPNKCFCSGEIKAIGSQIANEIKALKNEINSGFKNSVSSTNSTTSAIGPLRMMGQVASELKTISRNTRKQGLIGSLFSGAIDGFLMGAFQKSGGKFAENFNKILTKKTRNNISSTQSQITQSRSNIAELRQQKKTLKNTEPTFAIDDQIKKEENRIKELNKELKRLESQLDDSFDFLGGKQLAVKAIRLKRFGDSVAKNVFAFNDLKEVKDVTLDAMGTLFNAFTDEKFYKEMEDTYVDYMQQVEILGKDAKIEQEKAIKRLTGRFDRVSERVSARAIGGTLKSVAQPLRVRKRVETARSAKMAFEQMPYMTNNVLSEKERAGIETTDNVVLFVGGVTPMTSKPGQPDVSTTINGANALAGILPNTFVKGVTNTVSNSLEAVEKSATFGGRKLIANLIRDHKDLIDKIAPGNTLEQDMGALLAPHPIDRAIQVNFQGFDEDAIKLAIHALTIAKEYPNKKIALIGGSGGGYTVEEAVSIIEQFIQQYPEMADIAKNIKGGLGVGTPDFNLTRTAPLDKYKGVLGDKDHFTPAVLGFLDTKDEEERQEILSKLPGEFMLPKGAIRPSESFFMVPGGKGHAIQVMLGTGLARNKDGSLPPLAKGASHLFTDQEYDPNKITIPEKSGNSNLTMAKALFGTIEGALWHFTEKNNANKWTIDESLTSSIPDLERLIDAVENGSIQYENGVRLQQMWMTSFSNFIKGGLNTSTGKELLPYLEKVGDEIAKLADTDYKGSIFKIVSGEVSADTNNLAKDGFRTREEARAWLENDPALPEKSKNNAESVIANAEIVPHIGDVLWRARSITEQHKLGDVRQKYDEMPSSTPTEKQLKSVVAAFIKFQEKDLELYKNFLQEVLKLRKRIDSGDSSAQEELVSLFSENPFSVLKGAFLKTDFNKKARSFDQQYATYPGLDAKSAKEVNEGVKTLVQEYIKTGGNITPEIRDKATELVSTYKFLAESLEDLHKQLNNIPAPTKLDDSFINDPPAFQALLDLNKQLPDDYKLNPYSSKVLGAGFTGRVLGDMEKGITVKYPTVETEKIGLPQEIQALQELSAKGLSPKVFPEATKQGEYLTTELVKGKTLQSIRDTVDSTKLKKIAKLLADIHKSGWVHLDMSLANIMEKESGDLIAIDFANTQKATKELMRLDIANAIKNGSLSKDQSKELTQYYKEFMEQTASLPAPDTNNEETQQTLEVVQNKTKAINEYIREYLSDLGKEIYAIGLDKTLDPASAQEAIKRINTALEGLNKLKEVLPDKIPNRKGKPASTGQVINGYANVLKDAKKNIEAGHPQVPINFKLGDLTKQIVAGLELTGSDTSDLIEFANSITDPVTGQIKKNWKIHSPSRLTEYFMKMLVAGLEIGGAEQAKLKEIGNVFANSIGKQVENAIPGLSQKIQNATQELMGTLPPDPGTERSRKKKLLVNKLKIKGTPINPNLLANIESPDVESNFSSLTPKANFLKGWNNLKQNIAFLGNDLKEEYENVIQTIKTKQEEIWKQVYLTKTPYGMQRKNQLRTSLQMKGVPLPQSMVVQGSGFKAFSQPGPALENQPTSDIPDPPKPKFNFISPLMLAGTIGMLVSYKDTIIDIGMASINVAREFQTLTNTLNYLSGGAENGKEKFAELKDMARGMGVDFKTVLGSYNQLAASTRNTSLEGVNTDELIKGVTQAGVTFGLSSEEINRAIVAISQTASKGVLSAEEMRGQLSEAIPGSFQIAARAMKMTEKELFQLMATGQLASTEFLPKFARQLSLESGSGVSGASSLATASLNRLGNSIQELQFQIGNALMPLYTLGVNLAGMAVEAVNANLGEIAKRILAIGVSLLVASGHFIKVAAYMGKTIALWMGLPTTLEAIAKLTKGAWQAIAENALTSIARTATIFAVISAGIEVFDAWTKLFGNKTVYDQWAENVESNVKKVNEAIKSLQSPGDTTQPKIANRQMKSGNFFADFNAGEGFLKLFGFDLDKQLEDKIKRTNEDRAKKGLAPLSEQEINQAIERRNREGNPLATKMKYDAMVKRGETALVVEKNFAEPIRKVMEQYKNGEGGPLGQIAGLDKKIKGLKSQQAVLDPADVETAKSLAEQIKVAEKAKQDLLAPLDAQEGGLRQALADDQQRLEKYKQALTDQNSDDENKRKKAEEFLTTPGNDAESMAQVQTDIKLTTSLLDAYEKQQAKSGAVNDTKKLALAMMELGFAFASVEKRINAIHINKLKAITQLQVKGFSSDRFNDTNTGLRTAEENYNNTQRLLRERKNTMARLQQDLDLNPAKNASDELIKAEEKKRGRTLTSEEVGALSDIYAKEGQEQLKQALTSEAALRDEKLKNLELEKQSVEEIYAIRQARQAHYLAIYEDTMDRIKQMDQRNLSNATTGANNKLARGLRTDLGAEDTFNIRTSELQYINIQKQIDNIPFALESLKQAYFQGGLSLEQYTTKSRALLTEDSQLKQQLVEQEISHIKLLSQTRMNALQRIKESRDANTSIANSSRNKDITRNFIGRIKAGNPLSESSLSLSKAENSLTEITNQLGNTKKELSELETEYATGAILLNDYIQKKRQLLVSQAQEEAQLAEAELTLLKEKEQAKIAILERSLEKQERLNKLKQIKDQMISKQVLIGQTEYGGANDLAGSVLSNYETNSQNNNQISSIAKRLEGLKKIKSPTKDLQDKILATEQELNEAVLNKRLTLLDQELNYKKQMLTASQLENKAIENQLTLLDSQLKLQQAKAEYQKKGLNAQISAMERIKTLGDEIVAGSANSLSARISMENTLSDKRLQVLQVELNANKANLAIEQQREILSQRKAENEARMMALQARQAILLAKKSGDVNAIALAEQQLSLANESLSVVLQQGNSMRELHDIQRRNLELETQSTLQAERFAKTQDNLNSKVKTMNAYLDKQREKMEKIHEFNKAVRDARMNVLEKNAGISDKAIDLYDAINGTEKQTDPKQNAVLMAELQKQLKAITGGQDADPKRMYEERIRMEETLAKQKMDALISEQAMQEALLNIEFDKQKLQAQALVIQAKLLALQSKGTPMEGDANQMVEDALAGLEQLKRQRDLALSTLGVTQSTERYNQGIENTNNVNEQRRRSAEAGYAPSGDPLKYPRNPKMNGLDSGPLFSGENQKFGYTPSFDLNKAVAGLRNGTLFDTSKIPPIKEDQLKISDIPNTVSGETYKPVNVDEAKFKYETDVTESNTYALIYLKDSVDALTFAISQQKEVTTPYPPSNTPVPTNGPGGPGGPGEPSVVSNLNYGGITIISSDPTGDARKVLNDLAKAKNK